MRLFRALRNRPAWLRVVFAGLLLCFALNTVAHVTHGHDPASVFATQVSCDHCLQFGHLADLPPVELEAQRRLDSSQPFLPANAAVRSQTVVLAAHPRGPPFLERA
ncbi:MAG: hypothetical protein C0P74_013720 [Gammaproteobacteria bacterium]|nr:hypothetical protein [Gammaproteobacteria bacterium]